MRGPVNLGNINFCSCQCNLFSEQYNHGSNMWKTSWKDSTDIEVLYTY